ncbi:hypothetical protein N7495_005007 [Penicillium taxi]|uniref:uncharacterized protein n=1 Tax=Penicillium taxi TaxID=168475 RepID=UPI0025450D18|nr:uncharacterized protein N7495_005007 [Penicillium taxi]KAJ5893316.1 hypothetical protein N7495_005007 [Penicillium taxi]
MIPPVQAASILSRHIVFIHGLRAEADEIESDVLWPEKLLAKQVPKARILSFEYDDAVIDSFWSKDDLIDGISDDLIAELMRERRGDRVWTLRHDLDFAKIDSSQAGRPLIFAAHCLGGLVCENGLILFATPHYQPKTLSEATKYFLLAEQDFPSDYNLELLSKRILTIPSHFAQLRQHYPVKIECFYEGASTQLKNQSMKIVDMSLAQFPGGSPATRLTGNHHQIYRFEDEKDKDFKRVSRVFQEWVDALPDAEGKGTTSNISHTSFTGTNHGYQLGQNNGNQTGFVFGGK